MGLGLRWRLGQGPFLTVSPTCGDPANPVIPVHGEGWLNSGSILIELLKDNVRVGNSVSVKARPTFDVSFSPGVTLDPGEYQVHATWSSGEFYEDEYAYFYTPCPQARVDPVCGKTAGTPPDRMSIFITGISGWQQGTADGYDEIQVVFDLYGHPQEFFFSADPYEGEVGIYKDGSFRMLEINPYLRPNGVYTIQIKQQGYGDEPLLQQQVLFDVPCANPTVTTDKTCGPPAIVGDTAKQYDVTVSGSGFVPSQPVTVVFDADQLAAGVGFPPDTFNGKTSKNGQFQLTINPAFRPPGTYRIVAFQDLITGHFEASAAFTTPCRVLAPAMTIDPICEPAAAGQVGAYTLTLTGSGFATGFVQLVFDPTGAPVAGAVQAGARGDFVVPVHRRRTAAGCVLGRGQPDDRARAARSDDCVSACSMYGLDPAHHARFRAARLRAAR